MAKREKIPGVYMIKNKLNGRIYIGQSVDVEMRFKRYKWAVQSPETNYSEMIREIVQDMCEHGIENFKFEVLASGKKFEDKHVRLAKEVEFIKKYDSLYPKGYNRSMGGESGPINPRQQELLEKLKRAKPVYLYDTKKDRLKMFLTGAKGVGDKLGYDKAVMSHTVSRGSMIEGRYYVIPAEYDARHKLLEKLRVKKVDNAHDSQRAKSHAGNAFNKYKEVVELIDTRTGSDN